MDEHEHESEERGLPVDHVMTDTSDRTAAIVWAALSLAALGALVLVAVLVDDPPVWLLVILAVFGVGLLVLAWTKVRVWAGWSNPQLFLPSSDPLHLGDHVVVRVRRSARGRADASGVQVSAEVRVLERVRPARGEVLTEVVHTAPAEITLVDSTATTVEADIGVDIPLAAAPPSLDLPNNEVVWELVVDMAAPNAPDDRSTFALEVAPQVAERLQSGGSGR